MYMFESSLMFLEEGVCYDLCVLLTKLCWPLAYFILYSKAKFTCYSRYLFVLYFCIPEPYDEKDFFVVFVLDSLAGLHRMIQLQLLWHYWLGHRFGLL